MSRQEVVLPCWSLVGFAGHYCHIGSFAQYVLYPSRIHTYISFSRDETLAALLFVCVNLCFRLLHVHVSSHEKSEGSRAF